MSNQRKKASWYVAGLHFECLRCGACCCGPGEGYIWITRPEIYLIADLLKETAGQVRKKYLKRIGFRTTIIEQSGSKDCVFLRKIDGQKRCVIYPARPSQCRNWPFWPENLKKPAAWNKATHKCPGINQGRLYGLEEIEKIKRQKKWWSKNKQTAGCSKK